MGMASGAPGRQIQLLGVAGEDLLGEEEPWNRLVSDGQEDDPGQVGGVGYVQPRFGGPWRGQERLASEGGALEPDRTSSCSWTGASPASLSADRIGSTIVGGCRGLRL